MEKVNLFEADIDVEGIKTSLAELRIEIDATKKSQKGLDTTTVEGAKTFEENRAKIKALTTESNDYQKVLVQLNDKSGGFLDVSQKLNQSLEKEVNSIAGARESNKELLAIRNRLNLTTVEGRKQQDLINQKLDENNAFIKENVSAYEQQKIGIGDYETAIRSALSGTSLFNNELSNTITFFTGSLDLMSPFKSSLNGVATQYKQSALEAKKLSGAQKAMAIATNLGSSALKLFRIALISTGIGAIVVALGSLIAYLTTTQKGIDTVTKVTKPLSVIFGRVLGLLQDLGGAMFEAFSNPKQTIISLGELIKNQIVNRVKGSIDFVINLGKALASLLSFDADKISEAFVAVGDSALQAATGVENVREKVTNAAKETANFLQESIDLGNKLRDLEIEIEEREISIASARERTTTAIKQQELIAKDTSRSAKERNAAAEEAARLADEQILKEEAILKLQIEALRIKQSENDTSRADLKELDELEAELIAKSREREEVRLQFLGEQADFRKQQAEQAKKVNQERLKSIEDDTKAEIEAAKIRLKLIKEENDARFLPLADQIQQAQDVRDIKLAIIKQEEDAYKASQEFINDSEAERTTKFLKFSQERTTANAGYYENEAELTLELARVELESVKEKNQSILEQGEFLSEQLKTQEEERINANLDAELAFLEQKKELNLIGEADFLTEKSTLLQDFQTQQDELDEKRRASIREQDIADFENELEIRRLQGESIFEIQRDELLRKQELEREAAEQTGEDLIKLEEKFALQREKINKAEAQSKIAATQDAIGSVAGLLQQFSDESKELAISAAIIDGALAIQKALASAPPPLNFISAATVAVSTAKNISAVRKAERGISFEGTLQGRSHAQGGINLGNGVEAEGGENMYSGGGRTYVVNKKASRLINRLGILGALSFINQREGRGIPLTNHTSYAARGGLIPSSPSVNVNGGANATELLEAFSQAQFSVSVDEINQAQANKVKVSEFATL